MFCLNKNRFFLPGTRGVSRFLDIAGLVGYKEPIVRGVRLRTVVCGAVAQLGER